MWYAGWIKKAESALRKLQIDTLFEFGNSESEGAASLFILLRSFFYYFLSSFLHINLLKLQALVIQKSAWRLEEFPSNGVLCGTHLKE